MECLDQRLRFYKNNNTFDENISILLSSLHVATLLRVHIMLHVSIITQFRWLAGNSRVLDKYGWSVYSMERVIDTIEEKMIQPREFHSLIISEDFMIGIMEDSKN